MAALHHLISFFWNPDCCCYCFYCWVDDGYSKSSRLRERQNILFAGAGERRPFNYNFLNMPWAGRNGTVWHPCHCIPSDEEENRAIREGLDEESLAIFDLLKKPDLKSVDIKRIKKVAIELLKTLKEEKLRVDQWRNKEATRDAVRVTIHDFLWSEDIGPSR